MRLYRISTQIGLSSDMYDSAVVVAPSAHAARKMHPGGPQNHPGSTTWCSPEDVDVEYIGTAKPGTKPGTVIVASFNAG